MIASSPNWHSTRVSDWNATHHKLVYGSKNVVQIFDTKKCCVVGTLVGHQQRVSGVQFVKDELFCLSCSQDKSVVLWDIEQQKPILDHSEHKSEIYGMSLQCRSKDSTVIVVTGDKDGGIVRWVLRYQVDEESNSFIPGSFSVIALTTHSSIHKSSIVCVESTMRNDRMIVAIGYMDGSVFIFDSTEKMKQVCRLQGHTEEVQSVSWRITTEATSDDSFDETSLEPEKKKMRLSSSSSSVVTEAEDNSEAYLATASKDKTVRIWKIDTSKSDSQVCQTVLQLPKNQSYSEQNKGRIWLSVAYNPSNPSTIVVGYHTGEILIYTQESNEEKQQKKQNLAYSRTKMQGYSHTRSIFSINFHPKDPNRFITTSMDRQIGFWDLRSMKNVWFCRTLGGNAFCMDQSDANAGRVCLGTADKSVVITDPSDPTYSSFIWKGIQAKVSSIKWHPTQENLIAFGTNDGKVGVCNASSNSKTVVFGSYHKGMVYEIQWIRSRKSKMEMVDEEEQSENGTSSDTYKIYSCGADGIIYSFDVRKPQKPAKNISQIAYRGQKLASKISEFAVTFLDNRKIMAVSHVDGSIFIFEKIDKEWKTLARMNSQTVQINRLKWGHALPTDAVTAVAEKELDQGLCTLASAADDGTIFVYNLQTVLASKPSTAASESLVMSTLRGHTGSITGISFSTHDSRMMASSSLDCSVRVWNVTNGTCTGVYYGHTGRVFCVQWSILDKNKILSGAEDDCVLEWNLLNSSTKKRVPFRREEKRAAKNAAILPEKPSASNSKQQPHAQRNTNESTTAKKKRDKESKSLLKLSNVASHNSMHRVEGCYQLLRSTLHPEEKPSTVFSDLAIYQSSDSISALIEEEKKSYMDKNQEDSARLLEVWQNKLEESLLGSIEDADQKENKQPNLLWLALAPTMGKHVWQTMSKIYARKFEQNGDVHSAVALHLATHSFMDAIQTLRRAGMYRDAVALWKLRVHELETVESDLSLKKLYLEWAEKNSNAGLHEEAAKCYIACGDFDGAMKALLHKATLSSSERSQANEDDKILLYCIKFAKELKMHEKVSTLLTDYVARRLDKLVVDRAISRAAYEALLHTVFEMDPNSYLIIYLAMEMELYTLDSAVATTPATVPTSGNVYELQKLYGPATASPTLADVFLNASSTIGSKFKIVVTSETSASCLKEIASHSIESKRKVGKSIAIITSCLVKLFLQVVACEDVGLISGMVKTSMVDVLLQLYRGGEVDEFRMLTNIAFPMTSSFLENLTQTDTSQLNILQRLQKLGFLFQVRKAVENETYDIKAKQDLTARFLQCISSIADELLFSPAAHNNLTYSKLLRDFERERETLQNLIASSIETPAPSKKKNRKRKRSQKSVQPPSTEEQAEIEEPEAAVAIEAQKKKVQEAKHQVETFKQTHPECVVDINTSDTADLVLRLLSLLGDPQKMAEKIQMLIS